MQMQLTPRTRAVADDAAQRNSTLDRRQQSIEELIKALYVGLTPERLLVMCAYCRKIRLEDGRWSDETQPLKANSLVSHTICPDCWPLVSPSLPQPQ